jgi:hypothetical protein
MPLSEGEKRRMIAATHSAALALAEDLQHIRNAVAKPESAGAVRRASSPLRRILIERGLHKIAEPRIGRISIMAPDISAFIAAGKKVPWHFLSAGVVDAWGIYPEKLTTWLFGGGSTEQGTAKLGGKVPMRLDNFLSDTPLCFKGQWASRTAIIKYVALIGHGVHSLDPPAITG